MTFFLLLTTLILSHRARQWGGGQGGHSPLRLLQGNVDFFAKKKIEYYYIDGSTFTYFQLKAQKSIDCIY